MQSKTEADLFGEKLNLESMSLILNDDTADMWYVVVYDVLSPEKVFLYISVYFSVFICVFLCSVGVWCAIARKGVAAFFWSGLLRDSVVIERGPRLNQQWWNQTNKKIQKLQKIQRQKLRISLMDGGPLVAIERTHDAVLCTWLRDIKPLHAIQWGVREWQQHDAVMK